MAILKAKLRDNRDLLKQLKALIKTTDERLIDFDAIYKAMGASEDYAGKKAMIEKKLKRMATIRAEENKYKEDKNEIEKREDLPDNELDKIMDLEIL